MQKFTPVYIILLSLLAGFAPVQHAVARPSAAFELRAVNYIDNGDDLVKSDFYRPAQVHVSHVQTGKWQNGHYGGIDLTTLSVAAELRFVSCQRHALEFIHVQDHLLHNYPSHHFW